MRFGTKKSETTETESDGLYLRNFKDGDTIVRFLQETDDWIEFREHYTADKKSYPCTRERDTCPGCNADSEDERKAGRKYACNVHVVKGNFVAPFRIPISLAKKMFTRSERNEGTITNRDYVVIRSGKFLETEYDVESDDKYKVDLKALLADGADIEEILAKAFEENAPKGDEDERPARRRSRDDDEDERPARRRASRDDDDEDERPARRRRQEEDDEDEKPRRRASRDDDDDEDVPRSARSKAKDDEDEFPSEAEAKSESDGDSVEIDEDELLDMTIPELKKLATKARIDIPSGAKKSEIIRLILAAAE